MKKRIISLILVIVMIMLSLASCGYSLAEDDLTKYASYNSAEFAKIFESIEIEDGDFTTDKETRIKKVADTIYKSLVSAAGTTTTSEGAIDADDVITYCYFAEIETGEGDEKKTVIVNASSMKTGSAVKLELGYSDLTDLTDLNEAIKAEIVKIDKIQDYLYSTASSTSSTYAEGDEAYISYNVKPTDKDTTTKYTNVKVILKKDADNGVHNEVVAKLLDDTSKKIATTISTFKNADETKEYSSLKVDWVVNKITEGEGDDKVTKDVLSLEIPVTLTANTKFTGLDAESYTVKKDEKVTYHVYLVSCIKVEALSAAVILDEFYASNITVDTLDCLKDHEDLVKDYADKIAKYEELSADHDHSDSEDEHAHDDMDEAEKAADAARDALIDALKPEEEGAEHPIVTQYKEQVKESLLDAYNEELMLNLAEVVWNKMKESVTVNDLLAEENARPEKLINEIYQIIYDNHEYTFYTSEASSDEESAYRKHNGSFESYLAEQTNTQGQPHQEAKHVLWAEAVDYVKEMIVIYMVAANPGFAGSESQLADKKAIKEYKKSPEFKSYEASHGVSNALAAYQFDLLMDYILETEMETNEEGEEEPVKDENGVVKFKNFKEIKFKTAEEQ